MGLQSETALRKKMKLQSLTFSYFWRVPAESGLKRFLKRFLTPFPGPRPPALVLGAGLLDFCKAEQLHPFGLQAGPTFVHNVAFSAGGIFLGLCPRVLFFLKRIHLLKSLFS